MIRENYGDVTLDFVYDANGRPYAMSYNGTMYYYILNLQGDVVRLVDTNGVTQATYTYDPWGKVSVSNDATDAGIANPLRYRGYYYDTELEMYYLQSRYYDPAIGRFINADAIVSSGQGFLGYNMFAYCRNHPVDRIDTAGYTDEKVLDDGTVDMDPTDDQPQGGCAGSSGASSGEAHASSSIPIVVGSNGKSPAVSENPKGEKTEIHHIVEQCQARRSGFSVSMIQDGGNKIDIPYMLHKKISGYYSSKTTDSGDLIVRNWLAGQSFEFQTKYGWRILNELWEEIYGEKDL